MIEAERAVISGAFLISVLCMAVVLAAGTTFPSLTVLQPAGTHAEILQQAVSSEGCLLLLPLICTFPYAASAAEEIESGFIRFYLVRTDRSAYISSKIWGTWCSGAMVVAGAVLINYLIYWLLYAPVMAKEASYVSRLPELLKNLVPAIMTGGICAMAGALLALCTMSVYMAYIGPFTGYYFLVILKERYLEQIYSIYPKEWIAPQQFWGEGVWGLYLFLGLITAILAAAWTYAAERRLRDVPI